MTERDVIIRISAKNLTAKEFQAARKQLDDLGKKAGLVNKDVSGLGKGFQKAANDLASFNPTAARATSLLSGFGAAGLAAGVGIGAVSAAIGFGVKSLVEMGDRFTKLSRTTTIATDDLQRMEAFGRPLGITLEQMASSSNKLDKALGGGGAGVTKALKMLNLSLDDLSAMTADERLRTVQIALSNLKNPLDQAFAGSTLLSKSWAEMRLDAASIEEGKAALEGLIIVSEDALKAGDALGDSWGRLWANMKATAAENSKGIAESLTDIVSNLDFAIGRFSKYNQQQRDAGFGTWSPEMGGSPMRPGQDAVSHVDAWKRSQAGSPSLGVTPEEQAKIDKLAKLQEDAAKKLAKLREDAETDLLMMEYHGFLEKMKREERFQHFRQDAELELAQMEARIQRERTGNIEGPIGGRFAGKFLSPTAPGVDFGSVGDAAEKVESFGLSLEDASDIAQIFGDSLGGFGEALLQGTAAGELLSRMFLEQADGSKKLDKSFEGLANTAIGVAAGIAALASATSTGSQGSRAAKGAVSGAQIGGSIVPGWGHLIGAGVGALVGWARGAGPAQVGEDAGRDIGAALSQALMEEIHKSGENAQLFLTEIFAEGNLGIDRFAEEVGDLFSMFERSEISEGTLISELMEDLPTLIEHFDELGDVGQEQLDRIINAAKEAGIDLGAMGDQLDRMRKGIPELTLEGFASQFDLSEEQQQKLQGLGLGIQTGEERVADELNVPLELLKELAPALEEIGISLTELPEFMASLPGIEDLGDLATTLQLPPELVAQFEALAPPDPKIAADATGASVADHLGPALDRLGDKIIRGIRDAVAQGG